MNQEHPDVPLLEHVEELIGKLEALGVKSSPDEEDDGEEGEEGEEGDWEDADGSDSDVEMS